MAFSKNLLLIALLFTGSIGLYGQKTLDEIRVPDTLINSFPVNTQFSIALISGNEVRYIGLRQTAKGFESVTNQDHVFEIGSVTKVFTAMLLADLVLEGKMDLNQPFNRYWKVRLKDKPVITLQQLANHTSGLPRLPGNFLMSMVKDPKNPYKNYSEELLIKYLQHDLTLQTPPGTTVSYSNLAMGILGTTLAKKTKLSYAQLLDERILKPLQMTKTGLTCDTLKYTLVRGLDKAGNQVPNWDFDVMAGAGALRSTTSDMVLFARAALDITSKRNLLMMTPTAVAGEGMMVGLGWFILKNMDGNPFYWHNGATSGYRSSLAIDPNTQQAVVVLSNVSSEHPMQNNVDALCFQLLKLMHRE